MKKYILTFLFLSYNLFAQAQDFITRWDLSISGSGATQLSFGVGTVGTCSYTWETIPAGATGSGTFNGNTISITGLPAGAMIRLKIDTTNFSRIHINYGMDRSRIKDVEQWGAVSWSTMFRAYYGCEYLNVTATDIPNLSNLTDLSEMFRECGSLNGPANINNWNTANVTNMALMFCNATYFNQPIGNWNTANVTNMASMFFRDQTFDQPIGNWNTSSVTNFSSMFERASSFNQPIGNWNTSNVTDFSSMFERASSFNQPIGVWNTVNVLDMRYMFYAAISFNQPIDAWNTINVMNMEGMFFHASSFNQPIGNWNTVNVTDMNYMFSHASSFNQSIDAWNTVNVMNMEGMFFHANSFNQPIGNWNTVNVTFMSHMFSYASSFNQSIGNWVLTQNINLISLFDYSGLDCANYATTLAGWHNNPGTPSNLTLGAKYIKLLMTAQVDRDYLVNVKGWIISGDVQTFNICCETVNSNVSELGTTLTATTGGAAYQWLTCNPYQDIIGETNQSYFTISGGSYAVAVTQNGCTDTSACHVISAVGLNTHNVSNVIKIFPNPVSHNLQIESASSLQNAEICVLNLMGQNIATYKNISNNTFTMDMSALAPGNYLIQIKDAKNSFVRKVLKE